MLGRKKKYLENLSFGIDIFAGTVLLAGVYLFLLHFADVWEIFLFTVTGYPFFIQSVSHLADEKWIFLVILFNLFASLRLNRYYQVNLFADWPEVFFQSFKCIAIGVGMITIFFYFFSYQSVNRSLLFGFAGVFYGYHIVKELGLRRYLIGYYERKPLEALLICPSGELSDKLTEFELRRQSSVLIKGAILIGEKEVANEARTDAPVPILGDTADTGEILSQGRFDLVFLVASDPQCERSILRMAEEQGIEVWYFTDFISPLLARPEVDDFGGKPVIVYRTTSHYEGNCWSNELSILFFLSFF